MKEHPIIFSGPMVRAILEGRKTQTRRVVTRKNSLVDGDSWPKRYKFDWTTAYVDKGPSPAGNPGPYLKAGLIVGDTRHRIYSRLWIGDILWVQETWAIIWTEHEPDWEYHQTAWDVPHKFEYRADNNTKYPGGWPDDAGNDPGCAKWCPSIHMPRKASRITLEITDVRVERVQEISEEDAIAEGIEKIKPGPFGYKDYEGNIGATFSSWQSFSTLWDSINLKRGYGWDTNPWVWVICFRGLTDVS